MYYLTQSNRLTWTVRVGRGNTTEEVFRGCKKDCFHFMKTGETPPKKPRKVQK